MTTICYKDGVLAADTQMVINDSRRIPCKKITILNKYTVIACAGRIDNEVRAHRYFSNPNWKEVDPITPSKKDFECILIYKDKPYFCMGNFYPSPIDSPYFCIGSGADYAASAMELGMSAVDAVKFAATLDVNTNNIVETYVIKDANRKAKRSAEAKSRSKKHKAS